MKNTHDKLRKHIYNQLKTISQANSPLVYQAIQFKDGYAKMEKRIIEMAVREQLPVQAILPHLENELSVN